MTCVWRIPGGNDGGSRAALLELAGVCVRLVWVHGVERPALRREPYLSLERDFRRRRQPPRKQPEDDISERGPEFGDYRAREMAAKTAFVLAGFNIQVSEDWVVGAPGLEPRTR